MNQKTAVIIKQGSSSVRLYLGVASVAANATESVLLDLMEDDSFLIRQAKCWESMVDSLKIVLQAPACVLQTFGEVLGVSPSGFNGHVLQSIDISIGYMWMDVCGCPYHNLPGAIALSTSQAMLKLARVQQMSKPTPPLRFRC